MPLQAKVKQKELCAGFHDMSDSGSTQTLLLHCTNINPDIFSALSFSCIFSMGGGWIGGRMKHWYRREPTSVIICCINLHSCCLLSIFWQPPEICWWNVPSIYLINSSPTPSWFYGVVVSTLDFESSDLGSTPGRTLLTYLSNFYYKITENHFFFLSLKRV